MMVVSAGASNSIAEIKAILELVSDPKKTAKALDELKTVADETRKLLEEKSKVEMDTDAKLKKLAAGEADLGGRLEKFNKLYSELSVQQEFQRNAFAELEAREEKLKVERKALDKGHAELLSKIEDHKLHCEMQAKQVEKIKAEAQAMKDEFEAKLSKLKQAMG